ncbi:kinetochore component CENP-S-domain-containing protein [Xylaria sp. CBS 124048]|nr:kinetochore component CENP-S-domain-containing protein [Xylaria sp. CBS 124048]
MANGSDEEAHERLKRALWYTVGKMVDRETLHRNRNVSPQFIAALTELVWTQIETAAQDLECFSRHGGRSTINTDDILLLARRNGDLHRIIKDFVNKEKATAATGNATVVKEKATVEKEKSTAAKRKATAVKAKPAAAKGKAAAVKGKGKGKEKSK